MKMMLVCENDAERELVARIFNQMTEDGEQNTPIFGRVEYVEGKDVKDIITDNPVVYSLKDDEYTVYNFQTREKTEHVEGDLAGLANLPEKDFPTL